MINFQIIYPNRLIPLSICSFLVIFFSIGMVWASSPDGARVTRENTCESLGLSKSLLGLCRAYAEAQDCTSTPSQSKGRSCEILERNFAKLSGGLNLRDLLSSNSIRRLITPAGGLISLSSIATVEFPAGAFAVDTFVTVETTTSPESAAAFEEFTSMFRTTNRLAYEVVVRTGSAPPISDTIKVALTLPDDFIASVPANHQIELFAQVLQDGGEEVIDIFELFPAKYDPVTKILSVELPGGIFSNTRDNSGEYIAVITVAPTPGINRTVSVLNLSAENISRLAVATAGACQAASIGCPLGRGCDVTSPYNPARKHPVTGATRPHYGTDYRAPNGSDVLSASDGVVERSYTSSSYGETIIIRHDDGSATLYAHLQNRNVNNGDRVTRGGSIGTSDNTGLSSGPHLHFEYVPNGQIIQSKNRIDPDACVDALASGSITVSDNGNLADDAFEVFLDGIRLGATTIGGANTLAVSNLIAGAHILSITAIIAPDNVGTYQITLNDGLTFAGGGTTTAGVLPQGGSISFTVNVPTPSVP